MSIKHFEPLVISANCFQIYDFSATLTPTGYGYVLFDFLVARECGMAGLLPIRTLENGP